jgi:hypothetical protein
MGDHFYQGTDHAHLINLPVENIVDQIMPQTFLIESQITFSIFDKN